MKSGIATQEHDDRNVQRTQPVKPILKCQDNQGGPAMYTSSYGQPRLLEERENGIRATKAHNEAPPNQAIPPFPPTYIVICILTSLSMRFASMDWLFICARCQENLSVQD